MKASRHIKRAFDKGRSWQGPFFRAKIYLRRDNSPVRLAVIISKKALAKAVDRNKLRRRVKAAFAQTLATGLDIAVLANKNALNADFTKLTEDATKCVNALPQAQSKSTKKQ